VVVQSTFVAALLRDVPPDVFRPRPKVMSSILRLQRREGEALGDTAARREFLLFVRHLFRQRRKTLRTTLAAAAAAIGGSVPSLADDVLQQRAETVAPPVLAAWWQACRRR